MNQARVEIPMVIFLLLLLAGCDRQAPTEVSPSSTLPPPVSASPTNTPTEESPTAQPTAPLPAAELPVIELIPDRMPNPSAQDLRITEIHMTGETSGWAFGLSGGDRLLLHTEDGGRSWRDVTPPIESWSQYLDWEPMFYVPQLGEGAFYDGRRAWISAEYREAEDQPPASFAAGLILSTVDAGDSWRIHLLPEGLGAGSGRFVGVVDSDHVWFTVESYAGAGSGYLGLYSTSDGGESWVFLLDVLGPITCFNGEISFGDLQTGIMAYHREGFVMKPFLRWTSDGGRTWDVQELPPPPDPSITDPAFSFFECGTRYPHVFSRLEVALLVECRVTRDFSYTFQNYLYFPEDGGQSWQFFSAPAGVLQLLSPSQGWMLGTEIYYTEDGGGSWEKINQLTWEGQFDFLNADQGWAVARRDDDLALVETQNGGRTWTIIVPALVP